MRVAVVCEESGVVRDAFIAQGHDAMSCDLLPTRRPGPHYQGDARDILHACWDLLIYHAPCTDICVSGAKHFAAKRMDGRQAAGISFFMELWRHGERYVDRVGAEQPIGILSSLFRKPDQIIQPWMFGHGETKATCLWLKGLPLLVPTNVVEGREARVHRMPPGPNRARAECDVPGHRGCNGHAVGCDMSGMSDVSPVAWLIEFVDAPCGGHRTPRRSVFLHNAIGDYRDLDPSATSTPLYSHATVTALMAERDALQMHLSCADDYAKECKHHWEAAEAERDALAKDAERLDYIERTFSGMTNRERYLPVQMFWGNGAMGRTLREACDKYMKRDDAMTKGERG